MAHRYFHVCRAHYGKLVSIRTRDGRAHSGRITHLTQEEVYLSTAGVGISEKKGNKSAPFGTTADRSAVEEKGTDVFFFPTIIPLAAIVGLTLVGTAPYWGGRPHYGGYARRGFFW